MCKGVGSPLIRSVLLGLCLAEGGRTGRGTEWKQGDLLRGYCSDPGSRRRGLGLGFWQ